MDCAAAEESNTGQKKNEDSAGDDPRWASGAMTITAINLSSQSLVGQNPNALLDESFVIVPVSS